MRIAVLVLGLILGAIMFVQTFLVYVLSGVANDAASGSASAIGLFMALLWLIAVALVLPLPLVSTIVFVLAGLLGFGMSAQFPDLSVWGGASLVLAVLSFGGWLGKRRDDARKRADRENQRLMAERLAGMEGHLAARREGEQ